MEDAASVRAKLLDNEEPLLKENPKRFVMFPIKHTDIWQFYKKAEGKVDRSCECYLLGTFYLS